MIQALRRGLVDAADFVRRTGCWSRPRRRCARGLPALPVVPDQPARRHAARRVELGRDRPLNRARRQRARRLRVRQVGGQPDRDPLHGRRPPDEAVAGELRLRGRERPRALSDPARREDRGRRRPPRPAGRPLPLPALRAVRPAARERGWHAGSGATWNLRRPKLRPAGWTSADAAGLPILPLLARPGQDRPRAPRDRLALAPRRTSGRRATSRPTTTTRRCRGWASGCD